MLQNDVMSDSDAEHPKGGDPPFETAPLHWDGPLKRTMGSQREQDLSSDQTGLSSSTRLGGETGQNKRVSNPILLFIPVLFHKRTEGDEIQIFLKNTNKALG